MKMPKCFASSKVLIGFNQSKKHIQKGIGGTVYLGCDVSQTIADQIRMLCKLHHLELRDCYTMHQLGCMCGIDVGCGVCVVLS